jgi:hypothetical protein
MAIHAAHLMPGGVSPTVLTGGTERAQSRIALRKDGPPATDVSGMSPPTSQIISVYTALARKAGLEYAMGSTFGGGGGGGGGALLSV